MEAKNETMSLGIQIDGADDAARALDALASAAGRANQALAELGEMAHGSIEICIAGSLANVKIMPADK